ncbi:sensor histidine kinase [Asticcacaulis sp. AC466]|uniref:sensor histidine kinase n=1 Tax=Asticcacaulis sp. AC466 TaxID=1282362 RepID=UPI0004116823|nr:HAMP domain-containing sensor histidine kinase [Asticcacaulis sp. AC466]
MSDEPARDPRKDMIDAIWRRVDALAILRPNFFRQTPFRLTLVFLCVYVFVAALVFGYIYLATSTESRAWGNSSIDARIKSLQDLDAREGHAAVVAKILGDDAVEWVFAKGVFDGSGQVLAQNTRARMEGRNLPDTVIKAGLKEVNSGNPITSLNFFSPSPNDPSGCCRFQGRILRLDDNFFIYVAMDMSWADHGFQQEIKAVAGGGLLVVILGLFAGTLINQEVTRSVARVTSVLERVQEGDLRARIVVRDSGDEFDALSMRINQTLDRMEKTMGNLKYAGDAIAHDLRSPLSRLRTKLEVSLLDVDKDPSKAHDALVKALEETGQLLRTFQTVFSMSRLQAQGQAPDQVVFSATELAEDMAELFEAVASDKGLEFDFEIDKNIRALGNRDFLAQALSNLLDNAIKYTPVPGGVTFRMRHTSQREIEFSITDTGPGVPEKDRARISERFVRLENSRTLPGVGLGLAMVEAVAVAHKGRLVISEGPGVFDGQGPGLRTALVLPPVAG